MELKLEDLLTINPLTLAVNNRESLHREYKEIFNKKSLAKYAKTIAAMANTEGGYLIFGIADKPHKLIGVEVDSISDMADITNDLNNWFEPHIHLDTFNLPYNNLSFFVIKIFKSDNRPVICKRNCSVRVEKKGNFTDEIILIEGSIYYRYSGN